MIIKRDNKNKFVSMFDPNTGFYMRSGVLDENDHDTSVDPFMTSYPELIDVGVMGHCVHGTSGLCIKSEIKNAMRDKDIDKRDVLRMVVDKAKAAMKEKNPQDDCADIPDDVMLTAINKEIKQQRQTLDALQGHTESYLAVSTTHKINILNAYLPKQMTEEEVRAAVTNILTNGDYPNFGMRMKACMAELKGKADNKIIKKIVENFN